MCRGSDVLVAMFLSSQVNIFASSPFPTTMPNPQGILSLNFCTLIFKRSGVHSSNRAISPSPLQYRRTGRGVGLELVIEIVSFLSVYHGLWPRRQPAPSCLVGDLITSLMVAVRVLSNISSSKGSKTVPYSSSSACRSCCAAPSSRACSSDMPSSGAPYDAYPPFTLFPHAVYPPGGTRC